MNITTELRVRSKLAPEEMEIRRGKCPGDADFDVLLTGATRVTKLDGKPLCVYLPGALLPDVEQPGVYDVLHGLRTRISRNRGLASGSPRFGVERPTVLGSKSRTYTRPVASAIAGAIDPEQQRHYCRLTAWTGANFPAWETLHPLLRAVARNFAEHVPERYAAQVKIVSDTDPAWVVRGTPFSTITVNNSYSTGCHLDKGDLDAGFSTITCLRYGTYAGGRLVFPQYRIAVDMRHGDLVLMDAHEWHGNTPMVCACGTEMNGVCGLCDAERISIVAYYRAKLISCGSPQEEEGKAHAVRERLEAETLKRVSRPGRVNPDEQHGQGA